MDFKDSFFEDEVRDGFFVPAAIKQAWGAQLEVLEVIDTICKKHNIPYWADWGTLLGAVRHGGFIPWDDDLDISMKRKDYEHFIEVANKELLEGFSFVNYATHEDFWMFLGRVVNTRKACFEKEHLEKFHGFAYIAGVDIFVLDYVSRDEKKEEIRNKKARYVITVADNIADGKLSETQAEGELAYIEELCDTNLIRHQDSYAMRVQLYQLAEKLFCMFSESEADTLTRMMPDGLYGNSNMRLPKEYYDDMLWIPFENTMIPVPYAYDEMLRRRYGDYMKLVRDAGGHDYPFFEIQRQHLQEVLDFDMPGYRYEVTTREKTRQESAKEIIEQCFRSLELYFSFLQEDTLDKLANGQQLLIDLGNFLEANYYGKQFLIEIIEDLCEDLFHVYQNVTGEGLKQLEHEFQELKLKVFGEIIDKDEVVFLVSRSTEWSAIESIWKEELSEKRNDVTIICIPYFYKNYDGSLRDMQYEIEQFPADVNVLGYDEYTLELHQPMRIYTQNPYDQFNPVSSVHPEYYSNQLMQYTDELIYVPSFHLEEFGKQNERAYFNMQYYCNMPGVINADYVIVQSDHMRDMYIDKLTEFAGTETKEKWKNKILVKEFEKRQKQQTKEADDRKIIFVYTSVSSIVQYEMQMIQKIERVLDLFEREGKRVFWIWKIQEGVLEWLERRKPQIYQKLVLLREKYQQMENVYTKAEMNDDNYADICDAYYGDSSVYVQKFRNENKPVMLLNPEV